ncbi:MAG: hypothetical protein KIT11_04375 [Fimbriimonadaceae bacterium]|nr:hypothetical protein [Fimbriimonadaceae bacterium]QYK56868.1 MAG: hypothetical protein KF733_05150 [Fimbriimonadaceae bacterium]
MALALAIGCGGSVGAFFERVFVSPTTRVVQGLDGRLRFDILNGTFTQAVTFLLANVLSIPQLPALLVLNAIDFKIEGQAPTKPLSLKVKYDPSKLEQGVAETDLKLYRLDGGEAVEVTGATADPENNRVVAEVMAEGTYLVAAEKPE